MGDKEAHEISSILKRKSSDVRDIPFPPIQPELLVCSKMAERSKSDKEDDDDEHGEGSGVRRQSVTFTTSSNEPCLDRRKLQRTPTPFHEILMAEGDKGNEPLVEVTCDGEGVGFEVGGSPISPGSVRPPAS